MIVEAERRFPCRIKLGVPVGGFGERLTEIHAWLDENCGADGWAMTPAGLRGVVNDAVAIYSSTLRWPWRSCRDGAPGRTSRSATGRFRCARMSRRRTVAGSHKTF
jgi:hypothetical protein